MKYVLTILLFVLFISSNGCMTNSAVQEAKGHHQSASWMWRTDYSTPDDNKSHPGYYFLIPLTFPADVVISPIELVWWLNTGWHT
jgi:hypothetical protein